MFDPLDHPGIPIDRHDRHWREFDVEPVDTRSTDPYTRCRSDMIAAVEANAEHFDRQFAERVHGADTGRSVSTLAEATAERRRHIAAVRAPARSEAEAAIDRQRTAFDTAGWVARNEREPDRSTAYRQLAWQHLHRLRRYAELGARAHLPRADQIAGEVSDGGWEALVVHESASCHLYYGFLAEEDDRRLRPIWELHLQTQLAHLRAASDLLRRYCGRDPQEVIGAGLPEPVSLRTDRSSVRVDEPDRAEPGRRRSRSQQGKRPDPEPDVLDLLTAHHARMNRLCGLADGLTGDGARTAFGDLAQLIVMHETAEEQMIQPLARRLPPDQQLTDRLLDEEGRISDALSDAVRAVAHGHLDDMISGLRDMVTAHSRREEHDEFPRLRKSVPLQERREMGGAIRTAEAAVAAEAGPQDPARAEPRAVAQTVDRARDALAGLS